MMPADAVVGTSWQDQLDKIKGRRTASDSDVTRLTFAPVETVSQRWKLPDALFHEREALRPDSLRVLQL